MLTEKKSWNDLTPEERQEWLKRLENVKNVALELADDGSTNDGAVAKEGVSDGVYKGRFTGEARGSLTIIISKNGVSGNMSGTYGDALVSGSFSGTVDLNGRSDSTIQVLRSII